MAKLDLNEQINTSLGWLRTLRDEIRVRAHLGSMDLQDALRDLETRLDAAECAAKHASDAVLSTLRELEAKFVQLGAKLASAEPLGGGKGMSPSRVEPAHAVTRLSDSESAQLSSWDGLPIN